MNERIKELAEQAALLGPTSRVGNSHEAAERFAELVAAHEREACAKLCEKQAKEMLELIGLPVVASEIIQRDRANQWAKCADAIRARR